MHTITKNLISFGKTNSLTFPTKSQNSKENICTSIILMHISGETKKMLTSVNLQRKTLAKAKDMLTPHLIPLWSKTKIN